MRKSICNTGIMKKKKKKLEMPYFEVLDENCDDLRPRSPNKDSEKAVNTPYTLSESKEPESVENISRFIHQDWSDEELHCGDDDDDDCDPANESTSNENTINNNRHNELDKIVIIPQTSLLTDSEDKKSKRQTALEAKVDQLERKMDSFATDIKDIKKLLKYRTNSNSFKKKGSLAAYCKEACNFSLLPKFRLKKVSQVVEMESNIGENLQYKEQLVSFFKQKSYNSVSHKYIFFVYRFKRYQLLEARRSKKS